jgi:hypothetical protein
MTTDYHLNEAQVRLLAAAFDTSEFFDEEDCPQYVRFDFPFPSPNGEPRSLAVSLQWGDAWAIGSTIAEAVGTNLAEQIMGRRPLLLRPRPIARCCTGCWTRLGRPSTGWPATTTCRAWRSSWPTASVILPTQSGTFSTTTSDVRHSTLTSSH